MNCTYLLEKGFFLLDGLTVEALDDRSHFPVLSVPKHLQDFSPVLAYLSHLGCHFCKPCRYEGLFVMKLLGGSLLVFLDVLVLRLKPHYKVFDLLLLGQHLFVPSL